MRSAKGETRGIKAAAGAVGRSLWPASRLGRPSQGRTMRESIGRLRPIPAVARVKSEALARVFGNGNVGSRNKKRMYCGRRQVANGSWMLDAQTEILAPPWLSSIAARADANPTFTSQGTPHHLVCKRWR